MTDTLDVIRLSHSNLDAHFATLRASLMQSSHAYPDIERWIDEKVFSGLRSAERLAYLCYTGQNLIACIVLKCQANAKICHIRVDSDHQNQSLGQLLMYLAAMDLQKHAEEVHITFPFSLWQAKRTFFESFGFHEAAVSKRQYRASSDLEMFTSVPFDVFCQLAMVKVSKLMKRFSFFDATLEDGLLMSIKPKYVDRILDGQKKVELRRKFTDKWIGKKISIYASKPAAALAGEAVIRDVVVDRPEQVWRRFGPDTGCSDQEFAEYVGEADAVYAICLDQVRRYSNPIGHRQVSDLLDVKLVPPQSYCRLSPNHAWTSAASVASLFGEGVKRRALDVRPSTEPRGSKGDVHESPRLLRITL